MKPASATPFAALLAAAALTGCVQGPDYARPSLDSPTSFRDGPANPDPASIADLPWWEVFNDPALQALIRDSLKNNFDLRIAISRIEQARALQGYAGLPFRWHQARKARK